MVPSPAAASSTVEREITQIMKPLMSRTEDIGTLQDLGRASIQIVHDLKNQLNGLKLYATFLRKRLERNERPEDEQGNERQEHDHGGNRQRGVESLAGEPVVAQHARDRDLAVLARAAGPLAPDPSRLCGRDLHRPDARRPGARRSAVRLRRGRA